MELTAADIAADLSLVDGRDTVSVQQRSPQTGAVLATDASVVVLKRAPERAPEPAGDGDVVVESCRWHLQASTLSFVPKQRDRIVDGADAWAINRVTAASLGTRYVVETTRVRE